MRRFFGLLMLRHRLKAAHPEYQSRVRFVCFVGTMLLVWIGGVLCGGAELAREPIAGVLGFLIAGQGLLGALKTWQAAERWHSHEYQEKSKRLLMALFDFGRDGGADVPPYHDGEENHR